MNHNDPYKSYMLRFRWVQNDDNPTWVVSLQNAQTGQQLWFSSLAGLIQFLHTEFGISTELKGASQFTAQDIENLKSF